MNKTIIAEKSILDRYDAISSINNKEGNLNINNWKFEYKHTIILNSNELNQLNQQISNDIDPLKTINDSNGPVERCLLHIPPMVFGKDRLVISNNQLTIQLLSVDALFGWSKQHLYNNIQRNGLNIIEVPYANKWKSQDKMLNDVSLTKIEQWDWTYSTDYCFTLTINNVAYRFLARDNISVDIPSVNIESSCGINYELLKDTSKPILLYDEIKLYQDDLEDCGEVSFTGKIRVMPDCWFILIRFYLRVDDALIRVRDTRVFHSFIDNKIHIEIIWRELDMLSNNNLTDLFKSDKRLQREDSQQLQRLPIVNDKLHIPMYYSITI